MEDTIISLKRQIAKREVELSIQGKNKKLDKKVQKLKKKCEELETRLVGEMPDLLQRLSLAEEETERNLRRKEKQFKTLPPYWNAPVHSQLRECLEREGLTPLDWENTQVISDAWEKYKIPLRGKILTQAQVQEDKKVFEALSQDPELIKAHGRQMAVMKKMMDFFELHPQVEELEPKECEEGSHG